DKRQVRVDLASFYQKSGQPDKAEPLLREFLQHWEVSPEQKAWARRGLALILGARKDYRRFQDALALLRQNRQASVDPVADQRVQAVLLSTHAKHRREAIRLFEDLNRQHPLAGPDR